jgi:hypothetical protein
VEDRAGEGVDAPAASTAPEVEDRGAMAAMSRHAVIGMAAWAVQALGVQPGDELGGAGVSIHQADAGEVHGRLQIRAMRSDTPEYLPAGPRL